MFKKTVKMTLTINATEDAITQSNGEVPQTLPETYTVTFTHIAGKCFSIVIHTYVCTHTLNIV